MKTTTEIIATTIVQPLHLRPMAELVDVHVSTTSRWTDSRWLFDNPTHGSTTGSSSVKWAKVLDDGSLLTDPKHSRLLDWLRRVVWGLFAAPGDDANPLSPATIGSLSIGLTHTVPWLVANAIRWPSEITQDVLDAFLYDLPQRLAVIGESDEGEDIGEPTVSYGAAAFAIRVFRNIWQQRNELEAVGIAPMPREPWGSKSVRRLASRISGQVPGWIQPIPDEAAVEILNAAMAFIGQNADEILHLRDQAEAAWVAGGPGNCLGDGTDKTSRSNARAKILAAFEFSCPDGGDSPWHPSLGSLTRSDGSRGSMLALKHLVYDLAGACCLGLMGFTGMRVSEICGLRGGIDPETGFPRDVRIETTPTGLFERCVVRSELSKQQSSPREVPWLLGLRRKGAEDTPMALRCMQVLDRLMSPYQALLGTDRLLVGLCGAAGLPRTIDGVRRLSGARLTEFCRGFINRRTDLSELPNESRNAIEPDDLAQWKEKKGALFTCHRLRNNYAQFVLAVNPRLLPAVKRQFHHQNMMITDAGYWGANTPQVAPIKTMERQTAAMMMVGVLRGMDKLAGKKGSRIMESQQLKELRERTKGMDLRSVWVLAMRWVEQEGVMGIHSPHGTCSVNVSKSKMLCHKMAGTVPIGPSPQPNYSMRNAQLCSGCWCNIIYSGNIPDWIERYVATSVALRQSEQAGEDMRKFRSGRTLQKTAAAVLRKLGVRILTLEGEIGKRMVSHG